MAEKITFEVVLENGKLKAQTTETKENLKDVGESAEKAGKQGAKGVGKLTNAFKGMQAAVKGTIILAVVGAIYKLGKTALTASSEMEKHRIAFETMLKSASKAKKLLTDIKKFSATTPFQLPGLIQTSKRLLAFGVAEDEIIEKMKNLGNIAQGNAETLDRVSLAYGKIRARGKASMEELNQLLEAGVPILDELSTQFGVSKQELFKMVQTGKVGFKEVDKAITSLTTGTGTFAGMLEKQSQSLGGMFSTLKDNIFLLVLELGDKLSPAFKNLIGAFGNATKSGGSFAKILGLVGTVASKIINGIALLVVGLQLLTNKISSTIDKIQRKEAKHRLGVLKKARENATTTKSQIKLDSLIAKKQEEIDKLNGSINGSRKEANMLMKQASDIGKDLLGIDREVSKEVEKQNSLLKQQQQIVTGSGGGGTRPPGKPAGEKKESLATKHGFTMDFYAGKDPIDLADAYVSTLSSTLSKSAELWDEYYSQQAARVDADLEHKLLKNEEWYLAEKDSLLNGVMDHEARELALAQLESEREKRDKAAKDKAEKEKKKLARENFKKQQAIGIANVWIAAAQGVMQGFAQLGPIGGAIMAPVTLAMAGVQTGLIASQKPPALATGTVNVPQDMLANIHKGEGVIPKNFMDGVRAGEIAIGGTEQTGTVMNINIEGSVQKETEFFDRMDELRNERAQELGASNYSF